VNYSGVFTLVGYVKDEMYFCLLIVEYTANPIDRLKRIRKMHFRTYEGVLSNDFLVVSNDFLVVSNDFLVVSNDF
jgi:hypothetical protein